MFVILEIQTNADGTIGTLVHTADTRNQAKSIYHQVLAAAAISPLPVHACVMVTNEGTPQCYEAYTHTSTEE